MGKTAILSVDILADARDAQRGFADASDAAQNYSRNASEAIDTVGQRSGDTATGLGALSGALDAAGFGGAASALGLMATGLDAAEGSTTLFKVAQESLNLSTLKTTASRIAQTVATVAGTVATWAAQAATTAWTAVQWLLNAALSANPIALVVIAILALVAGIILAWKKSDAFREAVITGWNAIKSAAAAVWDWIVTKVTSVWNLLVAGVRLYIGIYVSIFQGIKTAIGVVWDWLKDAGKTALEFLLNPIESVQKAFDKVVEAIKSVKDWLGKIQLPQWMKDLGDKLGGVLGLATSSSAGTRAPVGPVAGLRSTSRAAAAGPVTFVVNVPEASDPVATARYLKALLRRGQAAGVMFGTT